MFVNVLQMLKVVHSSHLYLNESEQIFILVSLKFFSMLVIKHFILNGPKLIKNILTNNFVQCSQRFSSGGLTEIYIIILRIKNIDSFMLI